MDIISLRQKIASTQYWEAHRKNTHRGITSLRGGWNMLGKNWGNRNASVLVVQGTSANSRTFIHKMPEV